MKPILSRLGCLALTFTMGVAVFLFFKNPRPSEPPLPRIKDQLSTKCADPDALVDKGGSIVISVPNDNEFYIGKRKVATSEISAKIRQLRGEANFCNRVVFIKAAALVTLQTLDQISRQLRDADVNHIEFVLDKKKSGGTYQ